MRSARSSWLISRTSGHNSRRSGRQNIVSFRVDRCLARGLACSNARVLERGPSDHYPIVLDLSVISNGIDLGEQYSPQGATTGPIQITWPGCTMAPRDLSVVKFCSVGADFSQDPRS
jgi:hypothetical protein